MVLLRLVLPIPAGVLITGVQTKPGAGRGVQKRGSSLLALINGLERKVAPLSSGWALWCLGDSTPLPSRVLQGPSAHTPWCWAQAGQRGHGKHSASPTGQDAAVHTGTASRCLTV